MILPGRSMMLAIAVAVLLLVGLVVTMVLSGSARWDAAQTFLLGLSLAGLAVTVWYTRGLLEASMSAIGIAREEAAIAEKSLRSGLRPVIAVRCTGVHSPTGKEWRLAFIGENVGPGPALNVSHHVVEPPDATFASSEPQAGLRSGGDTAVFSLDVPISCKSVKIAVQYSDVFDGGWRSELDLEMYKGRVWVADARVLSLDVAPRLHAWVQPAAVVPSDEDLLETGSLD